MKLAFKGTDKNMVCNGMQYQMFKTYSKEEKKAEDLRTCSKDGFHYCDEIKNVHGYYKFNDKSNRFFIIEVLGNFNNEGDKSITTSFRFLKEITNDLFNLFESKGKDYRTLSNDDFLKDFVYPEIEIAEDNLKNVLRKEIYAEIKQKQDKEKEEADEKAKNIEDKIKKNLNLEIVKLIQQDYPTAIIGGSVALFLHGVRLERWKNAYSDIDIVIPYYTPFEKLSNGAEFTVEEEDTPSMSDFTDRLVIWNENNPVKVDICIEPKAKWKYIEHEGFKYRVNNLENIWEAKIRYGKRKHIQDLEECMLPKKEVKETTNTFKFEDLFN